MRNTNLFLIAMGLKNMFFIMAIIIPYVTLHKGMTLTQFMLSEAIFAVTIILFEIPSGWVSDIWRRKGTLIAGMGITAIGLTIMVLSNEFFLWTFGQILMGVGLSFASGTDTSLIYDSLAEEGKIHLYKKQAGRLVGICMGICGVATLMGGYLYTIHPDLPLALSVLTVSLAIIPLCFIKEPEREKQTVQGHPLRDMQQTINYALKHKEVFGFILLTGILFASTKVGMWLQQPYYQHIGINEAHFGWFMALGMLTAWVTAEGADWLEKRFGLRQVLVYGCYVLPTVIFLLVTQGEYPVLAVLLACCSGLYGAAKPLISHAIHARIRSGRRATIQSTAMLARQLVFVILGPSIGAISENYGVDTAYQALAFFMLVGVGSAIYLLHKRKAI